jgi:hypothetical protein
LQVSENRAKHNEVSRQWYEVEANRIAHRQVALRYQRNNPGKMVEKRHRYRARKAGLEGGHWDDEDEALIRDWLEDECPVCLKPLGGGGHMDHMIPVVAGNEGGASNEPWNMILLCSGIGSCNQSKGGRSFEQWRADMPDKFPEEQWDQLFELLEEYKAMWTELLEGQSD